MDMKRMSVNLASKLQQNLRPISTLLPARRTSKEQKVPNDIPIRLKKLEIDLIYNQIKENSTLDYKSNIKIITCLKNAEKCWSEYIESDNKNGQLACQYENRLRIIQQKYQSELSTIIITGQLNKIRQAGMIFQPILDHLQKKSRRYKQHKNEFKVISSKIQQQQQQSQQQQDEIKQEMLDLVQRFKKYAVSIQQNLYTDNNVIKQIGDSQDKQLNSLSSKNNSMQQIIKEQKLGFFQLVGMGIFGIVMWVIGIMIIVIV